MKKIEKGKPLPSHTKLDYNECYAKIVLEEFFNYNLLLDDKPDLQDIQNNIGVEVTIAEKSETLEAEKLYSTLYYVDEHIQEKDIKRIEQCGSKYKDGILSSSGNDDFNLINEAINCKMEKLKSAGYKKLNQYQLFIFSSIYAIDSMLQDELQFLLMKKIDTFFSKIYVLVPEEIYYFNLKEKSYKIFNIDNEKQFDWAMKARQMVEDGEKE